jgi:nucleotide-binding universal stress UspA family protein
MTPQHSGRTPSQDAEAILREAMSRVRRRYGADLTVRTVWAEGSRLKVLRDAAREARCLVVGQHHDSGPAGLVSAQGNLAVAGRVACPVIVVPASWRPTSADSITVGIDGTPLSLEAVEFAFRAAADRGCSLTVVHSYRIPYRRPVVSERTWQEHAALTVSETLAGWTEEYPGVTVTRLLTTRPVVATLARESEYTGLVVVGAHAGPLPIGDPVTRRTITEMSCPVAVVAHHVTPAERNRRHREIAVDSDAAEPAY